MRKKQNGIPLDMAQKMEAVFQGALAVVAKQGLNSKPTNTEKDDYHPTRDLVRRFGPRQKTNNKRQALQVTLLAGTDTQPPKPNTRPGRALEALRGVPNNTLRLTELDAALKLNTRLDMIDLDRLVKAGWITITTGE